MLKLENFEGPLDLLLQLIEGEKLDITEISLSQVTEQYFQYLDQLERDRSEKLADFLVIATKLIYLKSKYLLPHLYPEDEADGSSLADQLKMYKAYVEASKNIDGLWKQGKVAYGREEPPVKLTDFVLPANAGTVDLKESFQSLLKRLKPVPALPQVAIDYSISIKQTVDKIRGLLRLNKKFSFRDLLSRAKNRTEVIVNFLALLELVGGRQVMVRQDDTFSDLEVESV